MLKIKGLELKLAIQKEGIKLKDAAFNLGISRQTLINWYAKERLSEDILTLVKEKLNIDLRTQEEKEVSDLNNPVIKDLLSTKDKLIQTLESQLGDKEKLISLLEGKQGEK